MARIHEIIVEITKTKGGLVATQKEGAGIKFAYRGVDEVVGHLADALNEHGVIYWPVVRDKQLSSREVVDLQSRPTGKVVTTTSLVVDYHFLAVEDGSELVATVPGLAHDFADRSDAQSMSVALRTALIQIFKLQAGDKDPEQTGEEVIAGTEKAVAATKNKPAAKTGKPSATQLVKKLQDIIGDEDSPYDGVMVNALGEKHSGNAGPGVFMKDADVLQKILDSIEAGETA